MPTTRAMEWRKAPVAVHCNESKTVFHVPGLVQANLGIRDTETRFNRRWAVSHQPSGLHVFCARTLRIAKQITHETRIRGGHAWLDRWAAGAPTDEDYQAYLRLKTLIESHHPNAQR